MNESAEILSTRWSFWIAASGVLGIILSLMFIMISSLRLQVMHPRALPSYIPADLISGLQFQTSGELLAAVEGKPFGGRGPFVDLYYWDSDYRPARQSKITLDFGRLAGEPTLPVLISPFSTAATLGEQPRHTETELPYALSEDGSMIAWSWRGILFAGPIQEPKKFQILLNPPTPVVALSLFDKDLVGVLHSGGEFRLERLSIRDPNLAGTELSGLWRISGRGQFRVLANFVTGEGMLVRLRPKPFFQGFPIISGSTFITVSEAGRVAMGTSDGIILFPQTYRDPRQVSLPEMRQVQTLAFRDEENLFVGTDRGRLFLVEDETRASPMTSAPRGVRLLAVHPSRIAMATSHGIVVADLSNRLILEESGRLGIAITSLILSFITFFRLMSLDRLKLASLKRRDAPKALKPPSSKAVKETEDSTSDRRDNTLKVTPHQSRDRSGEKKNTTPRKR